MGNPPDGATVDDPDQLRVLRWLRDRPGDQLTYDSDLMLEFGFSEAQAQSILLVLQAREEIAFRNLVLPRGGSSLGRVRIRRAGLQRLAMADSGESDELARVGSPLRRAVQWFVSIRR